MDQFWCPSRFELLDSLNEEIWIDSPRVQLRIQTPDELSYPGAVGAQQAMQGFPLLPWTPDLLARDWRSKQAILLCGAAYPPLLREYSAGSLTLPISVYARAENAAVFLKRYLEYVVRGDHRVHGMLQRLLEGCGCGDAFALFNLCRASFVERTTSLDRGGDRLVHREWSTYMRYLLHPESLDWTWRRLTATRSRTLIALGSVAENALLSLFERKGAQISLAGASGAPFMEPRSISHWLRARAWWRAELPVGCWNILPIATPSPNGAQVDPGYAGAIDLVNEMQCVPALEGAVVPAVQ